MALELYKVGGIGAGNYTKVYKSTNKGVNWPNISTGAPYSEASLTDGTLEHIGGTLIMLGGVVNNNANGYVYHSNDYGVSFGSQVATLPYTAKQHASCVKGTDLFLACGMNASNTRQNKILKSSDKGLNWIEIGTHATVAFPAMTVHNGKVIVHGGNTGSSATSLLTTSSDGNTVTTITPTYAQDGGRFSHALVSFQGRLFMVGGFKTSTASTTNHLASILVSDDDGATWQLFNSSFPVVPGVSNPYKFFVTDTEVICVSRYNNAGTQAPTIFITTDLVNWTETTSDLGTFLNAFLGSVTVSDTPTTPETLLLSGQIDSVSSLDGTITVDTGVPVLETLYLSGQIDSVSSLDGSIQVVVVGDLVILSSVTVNGVAEPNVEIMAIRATDKKTYSTLSNADGSFQVVVETEGYYHIVYLFKDGNSNLYSAKTDPYQYVGGGV